MKEIICLFFIYLTFQLAQSKAQSIPLGVTPDSVNIDEIFSFPASKATFYYYKPLSYDSSTSPVLFAIHGDGGNGLSAIGNLIDIAERRKALIIAPNLQFATGGAIRIHEAVYVFSDSISQYVVLGPATHVFKIIYRHILERENRISIPAFLIGFSAGGQFVSRYMIIRQAYPDSIPFQMAVSSNAYYYTFPIDTFNGVPMSYMCGLLFNGQYAPTSLYPEAPYFYNWNCPEHVIQYYNENYGVLIGTGDTQPLGNGCILTQGANRYERALNFYNFCDSNAVTRGTTLQWQYVEIPGIGHDQNGMYNTKQNITDSSTIAETLLFDTPYHTVPSLAPIASFYADTTVININGTVNFTNTSSLATNFLWNFGDSTASTLFNPSHVYTIAGLFSVQLTAINGSGCDNWAIKRHYIKVIAPVAMEWYEKDIQIKIYPNPVTDKISFELDSPANIQVFLYDVIGREQKQFSLTSSTQIDIKDFPKGIYLYKIYKERNLLGVGKIVKQ